MNRPRLPAAWSIHRPVLANASSLVGTWIITGLLGALFWLIAARAFPTYAVGLASAAVAAMTLIGAIASFGLNTLSMAELAKRPPNARQFLATVVAVVFASGFLCGLAFAAAVPAVSDGLAPIGSPALNAVVFAFGVALTAAAYVFDQALIGLFRGGLQLWRNIVFAIAKLVALVAFVVLAASRTGMSLYAIWVFGIVVSAAVLVRPAIASARLSSFRPRLATLRGFGLEAVEHHAFNLGLKAPAMALPVIVTALLSAHVNAAFYIASMIAGFVYVVPGSLSTVLYAAGSESAESLGERLRLSVRLSLAISLAALVVLGLGAPLILGAFGDSYSNDASWALRILAFAALPLVVKTHYATVRRIGKRVGRTVPIVLGGTALELALATTGGLIGGLNALCAGWALALCVEAAFMAPTLLRGFDQRSWDAGRDARDRVRRDGVERRLARPAQELT